MSSKSKRRPNPWADPELRELKERIRQDGFAEGFVAGAKSFLDMTLYVFNDLDLSDSFLQTYHDRFMAAWDSRIKGYISDKDVLDCIKDERDWEIEYIGGRHD